MFNQTITEKRTGRYEGSGIRSRWQGFVACSHELNFLTVLLCVSGRDRWGVGAAVLVGRIDGLALKKRDNAVAIFR